jgi:hypothetical protein
LGICNSQNLIKVSEKLPGFYTRVVVVQVCSQKSQRMFILKIVFKLNLALNKKFG